MDEATAALVGLVEVDLRSTPKDSGWTENHADVKGGATRMDEVSMHAGVHGILRDMTRRLPPGNAPP